MSNLSLHANEMVVLAFEKKSLISKPDESSKYLASSRNLVISFFQNAIARSEKEPSPSRSNIPIAFSAISSELGKLTVVIGHVETDSR